MPKSSPHSRLIDALGGPAELARRLAAAGEAVKPQAVTLWRGRGIPHRLRGRIALIANDLSIPLPPRFLLS